MRRSDFYTSVFFIVVAAALLLFAAALALHDFLLRHPGYLLAPT